MIERIYDPLQPYRYLAYLRMSDDNQNPRSPDQQMSNIEDGLRQCGYPWVLVRAYRDDGITGKYVRRRPALQQMLRDIESGDAMAHVVVVDNRERLGRADEVALLRHKLLIHHGMFVVTADSRFANPTGVVGKALTVVEDIRSTEGNRVKSCEVSRGKKDSAKMRRWPGGPPPYGFRLRYETVEWKGKLHVYPVLEPVPEERAVVQLVFAQALQTGWGDTRMARWFNGNPDIPDRYKETSDFTVGYRLENPIYMGTLRWGAHATDIVNDARVIETRPADQILWVEDYCEPFVSRQDFQNVQAMRAARRRPRPSDPSQSDHYARPLSRGVTQNYPLSGLVFCAPGSDHRLDPCASGRRSKAGRQYVYYRCPRRGVGACDNRCHVPEDRLREAVFARLRARLLPSETDQLPEWHQHICNGIRHSVDALRRSQPDQENAIKQEVRAIEGRLRGWTNSLGDPALPATVRVDLTARYDQERQRATELQNSLTRLLALSRETERVLDSHSLSERLQRLTDAMIHSNPIMANLELSRHIDRIDCHPDGRIVIRGTYLGLFDGAVELLRRNADGVDANRRSAAPQTVAANRPRRRGRLKVPALSAEHQGLQADVDFAIDPERFAGLPEEVMWTETFWLVKPLGWSERNAECVYQVKIQTDDSFNEMARQFKVSRPTVQRAWEIAVARRAGRAAAIDNRSPGAAGPASAA